MNEKEPKPTITDIGKKSEKEFTATEEDIEEQEAIGGIVPDPEKKEKYIPTKKELEELKETKDSEGTPMMTSEREYLERRLKEASENNDQELFSNLKEKLQVLEIIEKKENIAENLISHICTTVKEEAEKMLKPKELTPLHDEWQKIVIDNLLPIFLKESKTQIRNELDKGNLEQAELKVKNMTNDIREKIQNGLMSNDQPTEKDKESSKSKWSDMYFQVGQLLRAITKGNFLNSQVQALNDRNHIEEPTLMYSGQIYGQKKYQSKSFKTMIFTAEYLTKQIHSDDVLIRLISDNPKKIFSQDEKDITEYKYEEKRQPYNKMTINDWLSGSRFNDLDPQIKEKIQEGLEDLKKLINNIEDELPIEEPVPVEEPTKKTSKWKKIFKRG